MVELVRQNFRKNKALYNNVFNVLTEKIGAGIPINHVGSTAIKNMYGKNIIDVLIGAKDADKFIKITNILVSLGYFAGSAKDGIYQFFASKEEETGSGDIHIHLVISNTERYNEFLILKGYLLNNKNEVVAYSNFKKELINKNITNRKEYRKIKSEYVTKLIERAKKQFSNK